MTRRIALVLLLVIGVALAGASPALAKSYTVPKVHIEAQLAPNGDMTVVEQRAVDFSGSFTRVTWQLLKKGSSGLEVTGITIDPGTPNAQVLKATTDANSLTTRPPGYYFVQDTGNALEVSAYHNTTDAQRTFELRYKVTGAVTRYTDCANLVWQFVGDQSSVGIGDFSAAIHPPTPLSKSDVKAWAHGPLTGNVAILADGTVTLAVTNLPRNTFVEADILYPATAFPAAPLVDQAKRDQIEATEANLANQANAQRLQARAEVGLAIGGPALLGLLGLGLSVWAFFVFGREHKGHYPGGYFREDPRPDLHPAVIGALWRFGTVSDADVAASLMDLANRKVITMSPVKIPHASFLGIGGDTDSFQLMLDPAKRQGLPQLDAELVALVFDTIGNGSRVTIEDIKDYAKSNPKTFSSALNDWKALASANAENLGFFEGGQGWKFGLLFFAAVIVGLGIWAAVSVGSLWPAVLPIICAIPMVFIAPQMPRRSEAGNDLFLQYRGLRDYLKDFSHLNEAPPLSVILWERFLVVAVVFGIAEQVIEAMRVKIPQVVEDPAFQTSYWWAYGYGGGGISPVGALSSGFASATSVASSAMSSASGGGGGFSGGGGFGGGGGGFGAD